MSVACLSFLERLEGNEQMTTRLSDLDARQRKYQTGKAITVFGLIIMAIAIGVGIVWIINLKQDVEVLKAECRYLNGEILSLRHKTDNNEKEIDSVREAVNRVIRALQR